MKLLSIKMGVLVILSMFFFSCFSTKRHKSHFENYTIKYKLYRCKGEECLYLIIKKDKEIIRMAHSFCETNGIRLGSGFPVTEIRSDSTYYFKDREYSFSGNECVFRPITDEEKQLMKLIKSDLERLNHCSNFGENEIIGFVRYERPKSVD